MPSVSKKQHNFMAAIANNPKFAKKAGVPKSVGEEFMKADKGRKFREGGVMKNTSRMNKLEELGRVDSEKAYTSKGKSNLAAEKKRVIGDIKKDKSMIKKAVGMHEKQLHGGKKSDMTKLKSGGMTCGPARKMAKGGSIDGCAQRGKTKTTMVKMKKGGMC